MAERTLNTKIQLRNDTAAKWAEKNTKLLKGEIGIEIDTRKFKIGDGTNNWNDLEYANITDLSNYYTKTAIDQFISDINGSIEELRRHVESTNNPHSVTASQVGAYTKTETNDLLDYKVDKVSGKGLSTNDYTTAEKTKLAGIETGANNYVLPDDVVQDENYVHTDNNYSADEKTKVSENTTARHTHSNKALLDTYDQTNANIKDAISKKHTHSNNTILNNTTASYTTADKTALDGVVSNLANHTANKSNPHSVTASQVGAYTKTETDNLLATKLNASLKGAANGVAELDENTKIKLSQLPDVVLGQVLYGGNVAVVGTTVTATLSSLAKTKLGVSESTVTLLDQDASIENNEGIFYIATNSFTFADISFATGDWLISTGLEWTKIDNSDAVTGVKGDNETSYRTGNVNITKANIGLGNVLNVASYSKSETYSKTEVDSIKSNQDSQINENLTLIGNLTNKVSRLEETILDVSGGLESENETRNQQIADINTALEGKSDTDHTHAVASANRDGFMPSSMFSRILALENASHTHSNKALLDTYTASNNDIVQTIGKAHEHSNKTILDNTTASFTTALKTKLDGISTGANKTVVDSAISSTSANPLQNKVITAKFQDIEESIATKIDEEDVLILDCGGAE